MAGSLIWSQQTLDDLEAIAEYIQRDSPHHARRVVDAVLALGESIAEQPHIGRIVPEMGDPNTRERFLYSYRLLYEISDAQITVLAMIHGRRLLESMQTSDD